VSPYITLEQWRALIGVIDAGGYAQAAEKLNKSQSAVTYAVQKIETLLNVKAFEIQGRKSVLYAIEAKSKDLNAEQRGQQRLQLSKPVLDKIEGLLVQHLHAVIPNSLLGKALHYLSSQWPKLIRFVDNGAWPIDNNLCENAIRPFVVGRRNWLFCDIVAGAQASANLYALIETCKANGIEPYLYLVELFRKLPLAKTVDDFEALLPWHLANPTA
jgi:transposase